MKGRPFSAGMLRRFAYLAFVLGALLMGGQARAAVIQAYAIDPAPAVGNQNFGPPLGLDFLVNAPITITDLGAFDSDDNGFSTPKTVQVFKISDFGTPLASVTLPAGQSGTLMAGYRFSMLTMPLVLEANMEYSIVAFGFGADLNGNRNVSSGFDALVTDNGAGLITFTNSRFGALPGTTTVNAFGCDGQPETCFAAGSFKYRATIPVPGALLMVATGLAALALTARKPHQPI